MAQPGCVLIRALEPVAGIETMQRRRPAAHTLRELASGPGRLTLALGITRAQNGVDVTRGALTVRTPPARGAVRNRGHAAHRHPPMRRLAAALRDQGEPVRQPAAGQSYWRSTTSTLNDPGFARGRPCPFAGATISAAERNSRFVLGSIAMVLALFCV